MLADVFDLDHAIDDADRPLGAQCVAGMDFPRGEYASSRTPHAAEVGGSGAEQIGRAG